MRIPRSFGRKLKVSYQIEKNQVILNIAVLTAKRRYNHSKVPLIFPASSYQTLPLSQLFSHISLESIAKTKLHCRKKLRNCMDRTAFAEISEYLYNKEEPMCVTVTLAAKSQNPRLLRWSLVLQKCKFTEVHIPGKKTTWHIFYLELHKSELYVYKINYF